MLFFPFLKLHVFSGPKLGQSVKRLADWGLIAGRDMIFLFATKFR
jgi:hypothetical protein